VSGQAPAFSAPASLAVARELGWRRVLVVGSPGAGKTSFAVELAAGLDLPLIHLDFEYWRAGWEPTLPEEWRARVEELISREAWVMDGNYGATLATRLARGDAAVFLDVPRPTCIRNVLLRIVRNRGRPGPGLPPGCPERFDLAFLLWVWNYERRSRLRVIDLLAASGLPVVHLRNRHEAVQWLLT